MTITSVKSAMSASPRAAHAAHRGALRKDQTGQTRARLAKTSRNRVRWPRTVNTAFGGSGVSGLDRNMTSQWTIPYNTSISNVAAEKIKLATTSDQTGHRLGVAIADPFLGCCAAHDSDTSIVSSQRKACAPSEAWSAKPTQRATPCWAIVSLETVLEVEPLSVFTLEFQRYVGAYVNVRKTQNAERYGD